MLRAVLTTTIDLIPDYLAVTAVSLDEKKSFVSCDQPSYDGVGDAITLGYAQPTFTEITSPRALTALLDVTTGMLRPVQYDSCA